MNVGVTPPILDRVDLIYNSDSLQTAGLVVVHLPERILPTDVAKDASLDQKNLSETL